MKKLLNIYCIGMFLPAIHIAGKGQTGWTKSLHRLLIDWEVSEVI
jgi:hypothetical protein